MNEESPIKRKIDIEEEEQEENQSKDKNPIQLKRSKSTVQNDNEIDSESNILLKQSIIEQVTKSFNEKILKLESRIQKLEEVLYLEDEEEEVKEESKKNENTKESNKSNPPPPALPPRDTKPITTTPSLTNNNNNNTNKLNKSTFGASSFKFDPSKTPFSSFTESTTVPNSPKPVFGATTSFGNLEKKDSSSIPKSSSSTITSTTNSNINTTTTNKPTFGFGSHSRFGNAFQESLKKKSFLDEKEEEKEKENNNNNNSIKESTPRLQEYKQVDLSPIEQTTGEEDEISLFNCTAKLFELNLKNLNDGWKERGVGPLHLNQSKQDSKKIRLVMRSNGLLKVILNYKISKINDILKGLESSLTPNKYFRLNSLNDLNEPIQYLLKFSNESIRNDLIDKIESQF